MTLNTFQWATNANYTTGPDTGTPTKVNPASTPNGFVAATIAAPQHVNYLYNLIAAELLKAVDGAGGGTYVLAAPLEFQGADVRIAGDLEILSGGELNLQSGGFLTIASSATLTIAAGAVATLGAELLVSSTGQVTLEPGAAMVAEATSEVTIEDGATVTLEDCEDLRIDDQNFTFVVALVGVSDEAGGVLAWSPIPAGGVACPVDRTADGASLIRFPLRLRPGDTLNNVSLRLRGQSGATPHTNLPTTPVRFSLISVDVNGVSTVIDAGTDPSGSTAVFDAAHSFTLSGGTLPHLVTTAETLWVSVRAESHASPEPNKTQVLQIQGTGVARRVRPRIEVI